MKSRWIWSAVLVLLPVAMLCGAQVSGTVRSVDGDSAIVAMEGDVMPPVGAQAEIYFKLAGVDEEVSVATGKVISAEGGAVRVKVEDATGEVTKDQLVRFLPGKGSPPSVTPSILQALPSATPAVAVVGTGYIGVQISDAPTPGAGALVAEVTNGGPAALGGVRPNDLIVAIDGSPVENMQQVIATTSQLSPGTRHALLVSREGKLQKIELTVGRKPEGLTSSDTTAPSAPVPMPSAVARATSNESSAEAIAAPFITKGIAQQNAGNIDGAVASYTEGIRAAPSVAVLYLNRANANLYKPNFQASIADVNKALDLKVASMDDAYVIRGTAKAGLGDYDSGIADCTRALKINPKHALAYNNRGNNRLRKGDYAGALADCNKSIALNPNLGLPYYNRGFVYVNTGNLGGALSDWKKAVRLQASFGAELNPKIAQLEARGAQSQPVAPKSSKTSAAGEWTDLTNVSQKLIGTWQGGRHRTQYFADGTFVTDPHLVPDPPRGQWQVQGDRLIEFYSPANITTTHNILSIDGKTLVIRNGQGETFRKTKIGK